MEILEGWTLARPEIRVPRCRNGTVIALSRGYWLTACRPNLSLAGAQFGWREFAMKWKTPVIIEIAVGLEINAYACAEV
jgi:coenzyme PQQ precursor peptide PqqA